MHRIAIFNQDCSIAAEILPDYGGMVGRLRVRGRDVLFLKQDETLLKRNYPFPHTLELSYQLIGDALKITAHIENHSGAPMPHTLGWHPYFKTTNRLQRTAMRFTAPWINRFNRLWSIPENQEVCALSPGVEFQTPSITSA